jgi:hypothetical protein
MRSVQSILLALIALALSVDLATTVQAAPIQAGSATYEYFNTFVTRLAPGTPFNLGPDPVDVTVESNGVLTEVWEGQIGDTIDFEIVSLVQEGLFNGIPFQIIGGVDETPELGPFLGTYTDIVQDPLDPGFDAGDPSSLISAFRRAAGPFAQVFIDGTYLYGADAYAFESTITGLPYPIGSEFVGTPDSEVEIRLRLGSTPDPANDPAIGAALPGGIARITRVVPEPASHVLMVMLFVGLGGAGVRRRR